METKKKITEVLKSVQDPELQLDIHTLGLIYEVKLIDDKKVFIRMTFTSPACPYGPMLVHEVKQKIKDEIDMDAEVEVTFDPPWKPSDELRSMLGV